MDTTDPRHEKSAASTVPQFRAAPRHPEADAAAPAFFAQFDINGNTLELLTPTTHESYVAATTPAPSAC